jgi:hypothetical protein
MYPGRLQEGTGSKRHAIRSVGGLQRQSACLHGKTTLPPLSNPGASHREHDSWIGFASSRLDIPGPFGQFCAHETGRHSASVTSSC